MTNKRQLTKNFKAEIVRFKLKIENNEPFAVVRFGDHETKIFQNRGFDKTRRTTHNGKNKRFSGSVFRPGMERYAELREELLASVGHVHQSYYVGLMTSCCDPSSPQRAVAPFVKCPHENKTFATVWINANYPYWKDQILPLFAKRDVVLVCHDKAKTSNLPFATKRVFRVEKNAWHENHDIIDQMSSMIDSGAHDTIFLFAAGTLSKLAVHQLFVKHRESNNTYLDVGSALDEFFFNEPTRRFLTGGKRLAHHCRW